MLATMNFGSVFTIGPAIMKGLIVGKEIFDLIEREPKIKSPNQYSKKGKAEPSLALSKQMSLSSGIRFENVRFRYPTAPENSRDIFTGVSFMIRPFTSTAIVGPSGSGKSTIVQLINRLYDPKSGTVYFNDEDLRMKDLATLRNFIGYVAQEPVLIIGTIRDNLLYGKQDASEQDLKEALELADASFVYNLEKGLDTYVGSGSLLNLSGG